MPICHSGYCNSAALDHDTASTQDKRRQKSGQNFPNVCESFGRVRHLYHQANRDLAVLTQKKWKETVQAKEEFYGLESSVALAEENVRLQEKGFSQGLFTSLDVVDARLFLESVKNQRLVASYNYVVSLAELLALSGEPKKFMEYQTNVQ